MAKSNSKAANRPAPVRLPQGWDLTTWFRNLMKLKDYARRSALDGRNLGAEHLKSRLATIQAGMDELSVELEGEALLGHLRDLAAGIGVSNIPPEWIVLIEKEYDLPFPAAIDMILAWIEKPLTLDSKSSVFDQL